MMSSLRKKIQYVLNTNLTHWIDTLLLYINVGLIALHNSWIYYGYESDLLENILNIFLIIFIIEAVIRLLVEGKHFFANHNNLFSAIVLALAVFLNKPALTVLLAFRSLRAWRTLNFIPKTRHLIDALYHTIPGVINIIFLIVFVFIIFSILGVYLFGAEVPDLWGNFNQSAITLQQIMLSDDWGNNLRATSKSYPYSWIFFISFLTIITFVLLNLFIGVIVDAMQTAQSEEESKKRTQFEEDHTLQMKKMYASLTKMQKELNEIKKIPGTKNLAISIDLSLDFFRNFNPVNHPQFRDVLIFCKKTLTSLDPKIRSTAL